MTDFGSRQEASSDGDAAFEQALRQALARAEAQPPAFLIPPEISLPGALVRSIRQMQNAAEVSRNALRLAFNFL